MLRVLLLADTHLGLGPGHFESYERALAPAVAREVDLVVHGGDVFYRSRVKPGLVLRAFEPLKRIADSGVPVVVVPGNHERSAIPFPLLAAHPGIHIIERPRTIRLELRGIDVAVAAFPNDRDQIAQRFTALTEATRWRAHDAAIRLLCIHQTVEGATVGPVNYTFRSAPDVIPARAIPAGFAAVLSGHIHRHQFFFGGGYASPVFYPGSTQRTSRAENGEAKGFVILEIVPDAERGGRVHAMEFHELHEAQPLVAAAVRRDSPFVADVETPHPAFGHPSNRSARSGQGPLPASPGEG